MTLTHRLRGLLAAAVIALCCEACSAPPGSAPTPTTTAAGSVEVQRSNPDAVAAAFAADYASGDTPAACALADPAMAGRLTTAGLCQARAGWQQTPRRVARCAADDDVQVTFQVDGEVDRFLLFTVQAVPDTSGRWSVAGLVHSSPGEPLLRCDPTPSTAAALGGGS
jgi:hypothetical protein